MSECESVRGEWGGICPDCGETLPNKPKPFASWMAARAPQERTTWLIPVAAEKRGHNGGGRKSEGRDIAMLEATLRHNGSRTAAANAEGVSLSYVSHAIRRLAEAGDERAITLREQRSSGPGALTERQEEVLRILAKHNGNRHSAARELDIAPPSLFAMVTRLRQRGVAVSA